MSEDFEKVIKVFDSCENQKHFATAKQMLANFFNKYDNDFDYLSKGYTLRKIQQTIDDCLARISQNA